MHAALRAQRLAGAGRCAPPHRRPVAHRAARLPLPLPPSVPLQYDTDVTTWSPQGRIFQIEYAMEAVKQGSAVVGLKVRA